VLPPFTVERSASMDHGIGDWLLGIHSMTFQ
jgi:hypothetical protein